MANILVVTALNSKDKSTNTDKDKVVFVDLDNNKIAYAMMHQAKIPTFSTDNRRYINDKVNLEESIGTLAFVNKKYKFYGVIRQLGNKLKILWITEENLLKDKDYNKVSNAHNKPFDITEQDLNVFNKDWMIIGQVFVSALNYKLTSKEKFIEEITNTAGIDETQDKTDYSMKEKAPSLYETDNNKQLIGDNESTAETSDDKVDISLVKRIVELERREEALAKKEKDIEEKHDRLSKLLAKVETIDVDKVVGAIVDVDSISKFDSSKSTELSKEDLASEFALKMANVEDVVRIDKKYISKITCLTRKTLESNLAYTVCKLFVSIKFERTSSYSIFGILDSDESLDYVKLRILKSYSNLDITDTEMGQFHLDYLKNRKAQYTR